MLSRQKPTNRSGAMLSNPMLPLPHPLEWNLSTTWLNFTLDKTGPSRTANPSSDEKSKRPVPYVTGNAHVRSEACSTQGLPYAIDRLLENDAIGDEVNNDIFENSESPDCAQGIIEVCCQYN